MLACSWSALSYYSRPVNKNAGTVCAIRKIIEVLIVSWVLVVHGADRICVTSQQTHARAWLLRVRCSRIRYKRASWLLPRGDRSNHETVKTYLLHCGNVWSSLSSEFDILNIIDFWVKSTKGPPTCKGISFRSTNFKSVFLDPSTCNSCHLGP